MVQLYFPSNLLRFQLLNYNASAADGLKSFPVADYEEIDRLIAEGTLNRTVAATLMNQTSSRAHTIVVLRLVQKKTLNDRILTTTSLVNIVDLAGRYASLLFSNLPAFISVFFLPIVNEWKEMDPLVNGFEKDCPLTNRCLLWAMLYAL